MCYLLELTTISYLGCAVSFISCVALIIFLCRKRLAPPPATLLLPQLLLQDDSSLTGLSFSSSRRVQESSTPIHLGLAISLGSLHLIFFLSPTLANVTGEAVCSWVGALLHYATLCSLTWMGIQVFHTFWMVCVIFNPSFKPYVWNLIGFGEALLIPHVSFCLSICLNGYRQIDRKLYFPILKSACCDS